MATAKPKNMAVRAKASDLNEDEDVFTSSSKHGDMAARFESQDTVKHHQFAIPHEESETFLAGEASPIPFSPISPKPVKFFGDSLGVFDGEEQPVTPFTTKFKEGFRLQNASQTQLQTSQAEHPTDSVGKQPLLRSRVSVLFRKDNKEKLSNTSPGSLDSSSSKFFGKGKRALGFFSANPRSKHAPVPELKISAPVPGSFTHVGGGFHTESNTPTQAEAHIRPHTAHPAAKRGNIEQYGKHAATMEDIDNSLYHAKRQYSFDEETLNTLRPPRPMFAMPMASRSTPSFHRPIEVPAHLDSATAYVLKSDELSDVDEEDASDGGGFQNMPSTTEPIFGITPTYSRPGANGRVVHVSSPVQDKKAATSSDQAKTLIMQAKEAYTCPTNKDYAQSRPETETSSSTFDPDVITALKKEVQQEASKLKASRAATKKADEEVKVMQEKHEREKAEWNRLQEEKYKCKQWAEEKKAIDATIARLQAENEEYKKMFEQLKKSAAEEEKSESSDSASASKRKRKNRKRGGKNKSVAAEGKPRSAAVPKKDDDKVKNDDEDDNDDLPSLRSSIDLDEEPVICTARVIDLRGAIRIPPGTARKIDIPPRRKAGPATEPKTE